ncbi:hypothetical protein [Candidatus Lucifugimonas marina]|uniref:Uncharacterized protein n=1 Tax=Candidatus Lucifugimonas marina TaxID=3038979 RepID=A0AAJ5ZET3_9CHLR|nr:hypothetical protein [SAR202 cluster bacterium JH702]MDG0870246.1 hypothetical protein [SAR202 cluster bacterium JH639]WFG36191.1 hypothetical protein GKN94_10965 [SAR202 cluster bacterium JH545]WFG40137.1 hypothetical protein GKO48_11070 [SAR202 cluster bacterium JH1073]
MASSNPTPKPDKPGDSRDSKVREIKRNAYAAGGVGREIGEAPQSRRYKIIIGIIILIVVALVVSDCLDGGSPPTEPRSLQNLSAPHSDHAT